MLIQSDLQGAANIGCPQYVTVNELSTTVAEVAGKLTICSIRSIRYIH